MLLDCKSAIHHSQKAKPVVYTAYDKNRILISALVADAGNYFCPECDHVCHLRKPWNREPYFYHKTEVARCSLYKGDSEWLHKIEGFINCLTSKEYKSRWQDTIEHLFQAEGNLSCLYIIEEGYLPLKQYLESKENAIDNWELINEITIALLMINTQKAWDDILALASNNKVFKSKLMSGSVVLKKLPINIRNIIRTNGFPGFSAYLSKRVKDSAFSLCFQKTKPNPPIELEKVTLINPNQQSVPKPVKSNPQIIRKKVKPDRLLCKVKDICGYIDDISRKWELLKSDYVVAQKEPFEKRKIERFKKLNVEHNELLNKLKITESCFTLKCGDCNNCSHLKKIIKMNIRKKPY